MMPDYPNSLGRLLNFSAGSCNQMCNAMLAQHDLTLAQWVILSALLREDGMLVSELANYSGNNVPAVSRIIDRMEKNGVLRREMDHKDRRAVRVFLTGTGVQLSPLLSFYEDVNQRLTKGFSDEEVSTLFSLLERVLENTKED